jgi:hypothetical protein
MTCSTRLSVAGASLWFKTSFAPRVNNTPPYTANPWAGTVAPMPYNPKIPAFFFPTEETSVDPKFRQPDTQQFNLNIQQYRSWSAKRGARG